MNAGTDLLKRSVIPKASCYAGVLSVLLVVWLILFVKPTDSVGPSAFWLSASLAGISLILGVAGLLTGRPYGYSVTGLILSGGILLFWAGLLFLAVVANMIALP